LELTLLKKAKTTNQESSYLIHHKLLEFYNLIILTIFILATYFNLYIKEARGLQIHLWRTPWSKKKSRESQS